MESVTWEAGVSRRLAVTTISRIGGKDWAGKVLAEDSTVRVFAAGYNKRRIRPQQGWKKQGNQRQNTARH